MTPRDAPSLQSLEELENLPKATTVAFEALETRSTPTSSRKSSCALIAGSTLARQAPALTGAHASEAPRHDVAM